MTRLVDVWRAVDPDARLTRGAPTDVTVVVRTVASTRAAPPHLPDPAEGQLLVIDHVLLASLRVDRLLAEISAPGQEPVAVVVAGPGTGDERDWPDAPFPILVSSRSAAAVAAGARAYLADDGVLLERLTTDLRLAAAEAALADPTPGAVAALVAQRMRRGVAVIVDGELVALQPRVAGRALAARFAAAYSRLFSTPSGRASAMRRLHEGMWVIERRVRPGAAVWLFDDLPMAAVDEAAAGAASVTLRALLQRPTGRPTARPQAPSSSPEAGAAARTPPAGRLSARVDLTLLAVARANGRVAPAARSLGVHRNTVLYRLRIARDQHGIDPRRPEDALRLLREADRSA